jgi:hypothetical protein
MTASKPFYGKISFFSTRITAKSRFHKTLEQWITALSRGIKTLESIQGGDLNLRRRVRGGGNGKVEGGRSTAVIGMEGNGFADARIERERGEREEAERESMRTWRIWREENLELEGLAGAIQFWKFECDGRGFLWTARKARR